MLVVCALHQLLFFQHPFYRQAVCSVAASSFVHPSRSFVCFFPAKKKKTEKEATQTLTHVLAKKQTNKQKEQLTVTERRLINTAFVYHALRVESTGRGAARSFFLDTSLYTYTRTWLLFFPKKKNKKGIA
jgi:hypothetical protein